MAGTLPPAGRTSSRAGHVLGDDVAVELVGGLVPELDRRLFERALVLVRVLGDGGRVVVADVLVERGNQHERVAHVLGDLLLVRCGLWRAGLGLLSCAFAASVARTRSSSRSFLSVVQPYLL